MRSSPSPESQAHEANVTSTRADSGGPRRPFCLERSECVAFLLGALVTAAAFLPENSRSANAENITTLQSGSEAQALSTSALVTHNAPPQMDQALFFVDPLEGNDADDGRSRQTPWKTLGRLQREALVPGDILRLAAAGAWRECLVVLPREAP